MRTGVSLAALSGRRCPGGRPGGFLAIDPARRKTTKDTCKADSCCRTVRSFSRLSPFRLAQTQGTCPRVRWQALCQCRFALNRAENTTMSTIFDGTWRTPGLLRFRPPAPSLVVGVSGASRNAVRQRVRRREARRGLRTRARDAYSQRWAGARAAALARLSMSCCRSVGGRGGVGERRRICCRRGRASVAEPTCRLRRFEHHFAHAVTALRLSPFSSAAVLICDTHPTAHTSVWRGEGQLGESTGRMALVGLARLYSDGARVFGFG